MRCESAGLADEEFQQGSVDFAGWVQLSLCGPPSTVTSYGYSRQIPRLASVKTVRPPVPPA